MNQSIFSNYLLFRKLFAFARFRTLFTSAYQLKKNKSYNSCMQQHQISKSFSRESQNYYVYVQLLELKLIDLIFLPKYDDCIFHARFSGESLPESCVNLFGDIAALYQFIQINGHNKERMTMNDMGGVIFTEVIENRGKSVKVQSAIQTQKYTKIEDLNKFYLHIVRYWQKNGSSFHINSSTQKTIAPQIEVSKALIKRFSQFKKMNLTVDIHNNPFLKSFSKVQNKIRIEDYSKNRIKLFFYPPVPKSISSFFVIRIVNTKSNNFGFGIIDTKEDREAKSLFSICYDFNSGDLKDSNYLKETAQCRWRKVGRPTHSLKNAVLRMEINPKEQLIAFYCNDEWVCQTVITNHLMNRDFVPYISVKHQFDQFLLNDQ